MRIVYKNQEKVPFSSLHTGEVFKYTSSTSFYIKIESVNDSCSGQINAIELVDGGVRFFGSSAEVCRVNCSLVVE